MLCSFSGRSMIYVNVLTTPSRHRDKAVFYLDEDALVACCYADLLDSTFIVAIPQKYVSDQLSNLKLILFPRMGIMLLPDHNSQSGYHFT